MAISSYKVELHNSATAEGTFKKFADIKDFPDLFGEVSNLETTTLSDGMQTFIPGIKQMDSLAFTLNWDKTIASQIKEMEGTESYWKVIFSDGAEFSFAGQPSLGVTGKGVDEVLEMTLTIVPSTEVTMSVA
ncbi:phage tail protein [Methanobrevibacter sp.]|uniref:phage tail protein n=1 Tax=Methanobrevibacter sp. TaxID=66852 RepID=UPI003890D85D